MAAISPMGIKVLLVCNPTLGSLPVECIRPMPHGYRIGQDSCKGINIVVTKGTDPQILCLEFRPCRTRQSFAFMAKTSISITMES